MANGVADGVVHVVLASYGVDPCAEDPGAEGVADHTVAGGMAGAKPSGLAADLIPDAAETESPAPIPSAASWLAREHQRDSDTDELSSPCASPRAVKSAVKSSVNSPLNGFKPSPTRRWGSLWRGVRRRKGRSARSAFDDIVRVRASNAL